MKHQKWYLLMLMLLPLAGWAQQTEKEMAFVLVEEPPQFVGGQDSLNRFIKYHLKYPAAAREAKIKGVVHLRFIIEADGRITNAEITRGLGNGCDEEALRVVNEFPKWKPGRQSGKNLRVQYFLPIRFAIE
ncbi:energy transducer TonB [Runella aurantiaca]|uniref:Energy transducer TonB n=1 Tax=Runella aurantiaca TaxID=2282308 RepID=A0A369IAL0_9BACT|nr:energy transducer TonB [Runella aurantiaca]RDB03716.1 energy transducer TonB [Runella aurantiaca]